MAGESTLSGFPARGLAARGNSTQAIISTSGGKFQSAPGLAARGIHSLWLPPLPCATARCATPANLGYNAESPFGTFPDHERAQRQKRHTRTPASQVTNSRRIVGRARRLAADDPRAAAIHENLPAFQNVRNRWVASWSSPVNSQCFELDYLPPTGSRTQANFGRSNVEPPT